MLESAFDKLCQYPIEYDVYFSGEELLTYCTLHDETYHLYIFDIEMPQLNGLELAKKIRENIPMLHMTKTSSFVLSNFSATGPIANVAISPKSVGSVVSDLTA